MPEVFVKELGVKAFELHERWIQKIVKMSETKMGYHLVDIYLKDGRVVEHVWVGNCAWVIPNDFTFPQYRGPSYDPFTDDDIADIKMNPAGIRHTG